MKRALPRNRARTLKVVLVGASLSLLAACGTTSTSGKTASGSGSTKAASSSSSSSYPSGPIVLISDSAAGSPKDVLVRKMAATLTSEHPSWHVVVEDQVGGDGATALQYLTSKPANGLNVLVEAGSFEVAYDSTLKSSFPFSDLQFVAQTDHEPFMLATNPGTGIKTLSQFAAAAKQHRVTVAGFGSASLEHLAMSVIAHDMGFKFTWIPYQSGTQAVTAAVGGSANAVMVDASGASSDVKAGKLNGVTETASGALPEAPGVPSATSAGLANSVIYIWHGLIVRSGTPPQIATALDNAVKTMLNDPAYKAFMASQSDTADYLNASQFQAEVTKDLKRIDTELPLLTSTKY